MLVGEVVLILTFGLDYRRRSIREFDVVLLGAYLGGEESRG
jgi:hypothetical protein